ncbi:MAG TPA: TIGR01459 family HAD-type hydrolase [Beijerinckiaceae bacterium]|jgi:HAD superfamily hydrolase (TIGR01459 family)
MNEAAASGPAFAEGFRHLAERYDVALCDIWGVLHDGIVGFPAAADALRRFRDGGGTVILVSNAPRPGTSVARQLDGFSVDREAYDAIVTSGDLTRAAVAERLDQVVHHLGPERDRPVFEGLPCRFDGIDNSDYVVCTGLLDDDVETAEDYRGRLSRMRARNLWMICANPDLVVERGDRLVYCAGALAALYEELGGSVMYAGKPHAPVYEAALATAARLREGSAVSPDRVLAIGDAIRTDIAGAVGQGYDALLVARGIHAADLLTDGRLDPERTQAWLQGQPARPTAVTETLVW